MLENVDTHLVLASGKPVLQKLMLFQSISVTLCEGTVVQLHYYKVEFHPIKFPRAGILLLRDAYCLQIIGST